MYKIIVPTVIDNGHFDKEKTAQELMRCGVRDIALAVEQDFSSNKNWGLLKELISYFEEKDFEVIVWMGEMMGHARMDAKADKGKFMHLKTLETGVPSEAYCLLDEDFITYCCNWIKDVAKAGAKTILIDDDYRLGTWNGTGCCCDLHMKMVRDALGENISLEELRDRVLKGEKNRYRDIWMQVQTQAMNFFARRLREAVDEVSSCIRIGTCLAYDAWDNGGDVVERLKILAGNTRPLVRTYGAPYHAYNGMFCKMPLAAVVDNPLGFVVEKVRQQGAWLKNKGIEVIAEGDTFPRPRIATPASYLECFDMIVRADGNYHGNLKYMLDYVSSASYESGYVDAMISNKDNYEIINKVFKNGVAKGLCPYVRPDIFQNADMGDKICNSEEYFTPLNGPALKLCAVNGLPTTYEDEGVQVVFGENARMIPLEKLRNGALIDIVAAKILKNRGVDVGLQSEEDITFEEGASITSSLNEYFKDENEYVCLWGWGGQKRIEISKSAVVKTQIYLNGVSSVVGSYVYKNSQNQKFLVFNFDAWECRNYLGYFDSYARKFEIINFLSEIEHPLNAYIEGNYPNLYMMVKEQEGTTSIGIWNLFPDKAKNIVLKTIKPYRQVIFHNCKGQYYDGKIHIEDTLFPYEFFALELKE